MTTESEPRTAPEPKRSAPREFFVTFGVQYSRTPHPVLGNRPDLPDGYWVFTADTLVAAMSVAYQLFGHWWSMVYEPENLDREFYPKGRLNPKIKPGDTVRHLDGREVGTVLEVVDDQLRIGTDASELQPANHYYAYRGDRS